MGWGLVCVALVAVVTRGAESFECPKVRVPSLIVDPDDCRLYYHCLPDGRVFAMQCPDGLVFDARRKVCVWDSIARACAPDHDLQPISSQQEDDSATNINTTKKPKGRNSNTSQRRSKTRKTSPPRASQKQNGGEERAPVAANRRSRKGWNSGTRRRESESAPTAPIRPTTMAARTRPTATESPAAREKTTNRFAGREKTAQEEDAVPAVVKTTADSSGQWSGRADGSDRRQTSAGQGSSGLYSWSRRGHSLHRRSPEDNLVEEEDVHCSTGYAYMPDPTSCSSFYHCYNWQPMKKHCPPGLYYDVQMHVCNWQHRVDCVEGDRGNSQFKFSEMRRPYKNAPRGIMKTKASSKKTADGWRKPSFKKTGARKTAATIRTFKPTAATKPTTTSFHRTVNSWKRSSLKERGVQRIVTTDRTSDPTTEATTTPTTTRMTTTTSTDPPSTEHHKDNTSTSSYSSSPPDSTVAVDGSSGSSTSASPTLSFNASETLSMMENDADQYGNTSDVQYQPVGNASVFSIQTYQSKLNKNLTISKNVEYEGPLRSTYVSKKPTSFPTNPTNTSSSPSHTGSTHWTVTHDLPNNHISPSPSASPFRRKNGSEENNQQDSTISTTSATALNTTVGSNKEASTQDSDSASPDRTEGTTQGKQGRLHGYQYSSASSTLQSQREITSMARNETSTPSFSNTSTVAVDVFKSNLKPALSVNETRPKPSAQTTAMATEKQTTPITPGRTPFYTVRNLRVQPITWMSDGRPSLRSDSDEIRRRVETSHPHPPSSLPDRAFYTPSTLLFRKLFLPDSPEDVQIEKFMINLLDNISGSKHDASPTANTDSSTNNPHHVEDNSEISANQPPTLRDADTEEDFTTTENNIDFRVSGKVMTDMTASISIPSDATNEGFSKTYKVSITEKSNNPSLSSTRPAEHDADDLTTVDRNTVTDDMMLQSQSTKSEDRHSQTPNLSKDKTVHNEQNNSEEGESDLKVKVNHRNKTCSQPSPVCPLSITARKKRRQKLETHPQRLTSALLCLRYMITFKLTNESNVSSVQKVSPDTNSTETAVEVVRSTTLTNQQTPTCNTTSCTLSQTEDSMLLVTLNSSKPSTENIQPSKSVTTVKSKTIPPTPSATAQVERSTPEVELFAAKEVFRAKAITDSDSNNGTGSQKNGDIVKHQAGEDTVTANETSDEHDKIQPNLDGRMIDSRQTEGVTDTDIPIVTEVNMKRNTTSLDMQNPQETQMSSQSPTVLSFSNDTVMDDTIDESSHKPNSRSPSNPSADDSFVSSSPSDDNNDSTMTADENATSGSHHDENSTAAPSSVQWNTSVAQSMVHSSVVPAAPEKTNTTPSNSSGSHTTNKSENITPPSISNSSFNNSSVLRNQKFSDQYISKRKGEGVVMASASEENDTSQNQTPSDPPITNGTHQTADDASTEEIETGNITVSTLLVSVQFDDKPEAALLMESDTSTSTTFSNTTSQTNKSQTSGVLNPATTAESAMDGTQSINKNSSDASVAGKTLSLGKDESVVSAGESKQMPVSSPLKQNTNFITEDTYDNFDEDEYSFENVENVEKSDVSKSLVPFVININQSTTAPTSNDGNAVNTRSSSNLNVTDQSKTDSVSSIKTTSTSSNSSKDANMTASSETVISSNSSEPSSWNATKIRAAPFISSEHSPATNTLKPQDEEEQKSFQQFTQDSDTLTSSAEGTDTGSDQSSPAEGPVHPSNQNTTTNTATSDETAGLDEDNASPDKHEVQEEGTTINDTITDQIGTTSDDIITNKSGTTSDDTMTDKSGTTSDDTITDQSGTTSDDTMTDQSGTTSDYIITDQSGTTSDDTITDQSGTTSDDIITDQSGTTSDDSIIDQSGRANDDAITDQSGTTSDDTIIDQSEGSFVSLTDLITWYLKHWKDYSRWRQDQGSSPNTVGV
ncbi:uncharacterized protein LOC143287215 [Babylonia areolata]|uniref:uncharacterized protein LOC143287215 n=1 Tax=Babylonia areolata TaxID=304850 RepID=UPI003FCF7525